MIEFKHLLCPVDFSETSIRALTKRFVVAWRHGGHRGGLRGARACGREVRAVAL